MANISWSHYLCRNALGSLCTCLHSHGTVHSWRLRVNEPLATNLSWTTKLWGSTTHGYFDAGVCVCVCVSGYGKEVNAALLYCWEPTRNYGHKSPKGIRKHSVTFGNKWEKGFFKKNATDFHLWNGLFVCPRTGTVVKVSEHRLSHKTRTKAGVLWRLNSKAK